jgi:hypothetical protein
VFVCVCVFVLACVLPWGVLCVLMFADTTLIHVVAGKYCNILKLVVGPLTFVVV